MQHPTTNEWVREGVNIQTPPSPCTLTLVRRQRLPFSFSLEHYRALLGVLADRVPSGDTVEIHSPSYSLLTTLPQPRSAQHKQSCNLHQNDGLSPARRKVFHNKSHLNPSIRSTILTEDPHGPGAGPSSELPQPLLCLSWETSHFLSPIWAIYIYGAASFSQGGHLAQIKMAQKPQTKIRF